MSVGAALLTWVTPTGVEYPLSPAALDMSGYLAAAGVKGLGLPTVVITADPMPRGGARIRHQQPQPRPFTLPVFVEGHGEDELAKAMSFINRWRAFGESLEDTRRLGPGQIIVARPDGTRRAIDASYETGWDNDPDGHVTWDMCPVTFYCEDPYWRDLEPILITRTYAAPGAANFLSPLITVTSAQTLGASTAHNPGAVEAWPSWRIVGPAASVTATNLTTDQSWTMDAVDHRGTALAVGEEVLITTEPATVIGPVTGPQGTNWSGAMNWPDAELWGLDPGDNEVDFTVAGSGSGTLIEAQFYPRYGTA